MSASLVGSEMCIRDSLRRAMPRSSRPGALMRPAVTLTSRLVARGSTVACLLYTSDAADDM
eukprot:7672618-Alexandrium_andersonii.AAC.1